MLHLIFFLLPACVLLLVVLSAALGYGALILSLLRLPQTVHREVIVFALGIGLGTLSFLVLCVGALGLIYPTVIGSILALGVAMAVVIGRKLWRQPLVAPHIPPVARTVSQQAAWLGLVLIIALALVFSLCAHALMPPVDNDVVAYHFAIPKLYIQAHGLIYLPYILHSNWPLGSEMLSLIGLIFHSEVLALLINWAFVVLLCVALVMFGERWLPFRTGWITAAVLCSVPMLTRLAGTGMVEVPLACYTFLAFYALWHWHESGAGNWLVLSALLAGCAAATKLNAAATAIIFALVALVLVLMSGQIARAVRVFALYGLLSFLVVLPWYIKAWAFTGNPIWPFLYPLLGGRNWDGLGSTYLMDYLSLTNMQPTFGNWLTGLWQVTVANGRFGSFLLGPYTLVLLPLGLLPMIRRPSLRPLLAVLITVTLVFYTAWFLMTHQTRFLLATLPFAILFGAAGLAWIIEQGQPVLRVGLQVALVVWLFSGAWIFDPYDQHLWQRSQPYLLGQVDREAFLTSVSPDYPAFRYVNQHLSATTRVLLAPYEVRGYYLDRAYVWVNPIGQRYLRLEQMASVDVLRAELQQRGVSHVLMNKHPLITDIAYWEKINMLLTGLLEQHGRLLFESGDLSLYVLDYSDPDASLSLMRRAEACLYRK